MDEVLRLKRLIEAQRRLRLLDELGLERARFDLMEAEASRRHALESVTNNAPQELEWLLARTNASQRTARRVESASKSVVNQEVKLAERAMICRLAERSRSDAVIRERARLDACALSQTLEWCSVSWDDSAGQD